MNSHDQHLRTADRDRMRGRVRAITGGAVGTAAVGAIALTVVLSGNADAGATPSGTGSPETTSGVSGTDSGSGQITVPEEAGSSSGPGGQLVPAQQQPQSGGGGSHSGSGGS